MRWLICSALLGFGCGKHTNTPPATPATPATPPQLSRLVAEARQHHTAALVVLHRGETVFEWPSKAEQAALPTMSITKSVVSLGVGVLVDKGHIPSIDAPMSTWIPEFAEDGREAVTLRHLLEHRSGLADAQLTDIYTANNSLRTARQAALVDPPGTRFSYNNNAMNLLPAVFSTSADQPMDRFIVEHLLQPMHIEIWGWHRDDGGPMAMAGLSLRAHDLARIGQLVLDQGRFDQQVLVSPDWIGSSTTPSEENPVAAASWWPIWKERSYFASDALLALWRDAGADPDALEGFAGQRFESREGFRQALEERLSPIEVAALGHAVGPHIHPLADQQVIGIQATGSAGQYLLIYPQWDMVIARQARYQPDVDTTFPALYEFAEALGPALQDRSATDSSDTPPQSR